MLFASFLASKWRWVVLALAIVLVIALGAQGLDYASAWLARRSAAKHLARTEATHNARAAAEPPQVHHFDSTVNSQIGQHREMMRQLTLQKRHDDSLTHRLPAAPVLPASPPHFSARN